MIKTNGYFRLHRSIFANPVVTKDQDYFLVWIYILSQAEYEKGNKVDFGGKTITLKPGQFTIGVSRQMLGDLHRIQRNLSKDKLFRILKRYVSEKQIAKQSDGRSTLITVLNYEQYQNIAIENATEMQNECETSAKPVRTKEINKKNKKNKRKESDPPPSDEVAVAYEEEDEDDDTPPVPGAKRLPNGGWDYRPDLDWGDED